MAGGGGAAPPPKQEELQPHPAKDQLPNIAYWLTALLVLLHGVIFFFSLTLHFRRMYVNIL